MIDCRQHLSFHVAHKRHAPYICGVHGEAQAVYVRGVRGETLRGA